VTVARIRSGDTEVVISAGPGLAERLRVVALPLAHGLSVVVELRSVLMERQSALDDATFQLRALRQVARLLSSVHSSAETEQLILDFMAEVFFTWWACLLRPTGDAYEPRIFRSLDDRIRPAPIARALLDTVLPAGAGAIGGQEIAVAALAPPTTELVVPLDAGAERLAVLLLGPRLNDRRYGPAELDLAGTLSFAAAIALKNAHLVEQLQTAANTDELTALMNRRALEERLGAELARSTRHRLDTTIILLDLDNFKLVNDNGGHAAGDDLLQAVGRLLKEQCRQPDVVGRLGGDEFLVMLPMTSPREAMVLVGRVQAGLAALAALGQGRPVTVSIGIAAAPGHGTTVSSLMAAADAAMYKAKRAGGNRAEVAGEF
jgi:diguanylate cyclase (GGDEF)-like protein